MKIISMLFCICCIISFSCSTVKNETLQEDGVFYYQKDYTYINFVIRLEMHLDSTFYLEKTGAVSAEKCYGHWKYVNGKILLICNEERILYTENIFSRPQYIIQVINEDKIKFWVSGSKKYITLNKLDKAIEY